ncbi:MAG: hypothetical protein AW07_03781 [Candidatus Accumulibacter sp. SK-11]|nr:MAG: hypothetical protein AW07_03781 [Candidatus Accumulibacter sp. SK-11]
MICPGSGAAAPAVAGGTAGCVNGAVAGTGGWLLRAPGTPCADGLVLALSFVCWLRMLISGGVAFGRCVSAVCSLCEKSMSAAICTRALPAPTIGVRMSSMRLMMLASISLTYLTWVGSRPASSSLLFICDSNVPLWSSSVTLAGDSCGTLAATRFWMPAICAASSERPEYSRSITDADGFSSSRMKTLGFGIARCTRAASTAAIDCTVRDSSPSRPRW